MKKIILIKLFVLFYISGVSQNLFLKINIEYNKFESQSTVMFFMLDDLTMVNSKLDSIKKINERNILKIWGLPLVDGSFEQNNCNSDSNYILTTIFKNPIVKKKIQSKTYTIKFSVIKLDTKVCKFSLTNKFWASYDVSFKSAGKLTSSIKNQKITFCERNRINKSIKKFRKRILRINP